jgi:hypothetical protein
MTRAGKAGETYAGYPARPWREWERSIAAFNRLPKLLPKLNRLLGESADDGDGQDE